MHNYSRDDYYIENAVFLEALSELVFTIHSPPENRKRTGANQENTEQLMSPVVSAQWKVHSWRKSHFPGRIDQSTKRIVDNAVKCNI